MTTKTDLLELKWEEFVNEFLKECEHGTLVSVHTFAPFGCGGCISRRKASARIQRLCKEGYIMKIHGSTKKALYRVLRSSVGR